MTNKFLHESGMSGRAIGNTLMDFERDVTKIFKNKKFFYAIERNMDGTYLITIIIKDPKDDLYGLTHKAAGADPDLLALALIKLLQDEVKKGEVNE